MLLPLFMSKPERSAERHAAPVSGTQQCQVRRHSPEDYKRLSGKNAVSPYSRIKMNIRTAPSPRSQPG